MNGSNNLLKQFDSQIYEFQLLKNKSNTINSRLLCLNKWFFPFLLEFNITPSYINKSQSFNDKDLYITRILLWRYYQSHCLEGSLTKLFYSIIMFYHLSNHYQCIIHGKITEFKHVWNFITRVKKSRTGNPGSNAFTYPILIKMVKYINMHKDYTEFEQCTLRTMFTTLFASGNRCNEVFDNCIKSNFITYTSNSITLIYNKSKTNQTGLLQCSPIKCTCHISKLVCGLHNLLYLFKNYKFRNNEFIFQFRGKIMNDRLARRLQIDIFNGIKLDPTNYTLHGFRKGSTQSKAVLGYSEHQLLLQHNWKSMKSVKPYFNNMDPSLKTLYITNNSFKDLL